MLIKLLQIIIITIIIILNIETANVVYTLKMLRVVKLVAFFIALKLTILDIINIIVPPQKEYVMYNLLLVIISYTSQRVDYIIISSTGELFLLSVKMMKKRQLLKHLNGILVIKHLALLAILAIIIITLLQLDDKMIIKLRFQIIIIVELKLNWSLR